MRELVSILIIGVVLLAGCASNPPAATSTIASSSTTVTLASTTSTSGAVTSTTRASSTTIVSTTSIVQATTTTQPAAATVRISGFAFVPAALTVSEGTTVTWVNDDSTTHTIVADGVFSSGGLGRGETFSRTFTEAGTFAYHCGPHPSMKGTIIVQ